MEAPRLERSKPVALCVDDDPANRALLTRALARGERFDVVAVATGGECIALAADLQPAVVLLDWMLPDMTGGDVLDRLASDPRTREIPVVVLSGLDAVVAGDTTDAGGRRTVKFVGKPYRLDELFAAVADATSGAS